MTFGEAIDTLVGMQADRPSVPIAVDIVRSLHRKGCAMPHAISPADDGAVILHFGPNTVEVMENGRCDIVLVLTDLPAEEVQYVVGRYVR